MWASQQEIDKQLEQVAPFTPEEWKEANEYGTVWQWVSSGTDDDGVQWVHLNLRSKTGEVVGEWDLAHYRAFEDAASFMYHSRDHRPLEEKLDEEFEREMRERYEEGR